MSVTGSPEWNCSQLAAKSLHPCARALLLVSPVKWSPNTGFAKQTIAIVEHHLRGSQTWYLSFLTHRHHFQLKNWHQWMRKLRQNSLNQIIHWSGVELSGGAYKCRFSQNTHSLGNYTTRFREKHLKKTFQNIVSGFLNMWRVWQIPGMEGLCLYSYLFCARSIVEDQLRKLLRASCHLSCQSTLAILEDVAY